MRKSIITPKGRRKLIEYINVFPRGFQKKLAARIKLPNGKIGITTVHLSNLKNGKTPVTIEMIQALEDATDGFVKAVDWLE